MYSYAAYPQHYHIPDHDALPDDYNPLHQQDTHSYTTSFSRGSPSPYVYSPPSQGYLHYLVDRGELDSRLCPTTLVSSTLGATGVGFSGDPSSVTFTPQATAPEDLSAYVHQPPHPCEWDPWAPNASIPNASEPSIGSSSVIVAPAPVYPTPSSFSDTPFNHGGASCHPPLSLEKDVYGPSSQDVNGACSLGSTVTAPAAVAQANPTQQLPTPAALAVLLNPNGRAGSLSSMPQQGSQGNLAPLPTFEIAPSAGCTSDMIVPLRASPSVVRASRPVEPRSAAQAVPEAQSREKKHACTMCHKRFDRPSTLRKHLLVHTGEKAHLCETCGRRFGVASNLNRHVKRCSVKPVNSSPPASKGATSPSQVIAASSSSSSQPPPTTTRPLVMPSKDPNASKTTPSGQRNRGRRNITESTGASQSDSSSATQSPPNPSHSGSSSNGENTLLNENGNDKGKNSGQKRRRRPPSPSDWVPATLRNFNLAPEDAILRAVPVPLPPVRRNLPKEERDSWDENVAALPYHPSGWNGTLPGPGIPHQQGFSVNDPKSFNMGGRGSYLHGRLMRVSTARG